ncbi:MAG: desulfoferrodoxin family protein [Chloroflexi bacterium]|nr:desulfoferrodoxin family protein [Chloroflexota bacterium]
MKFGELLKDKTSEGKEKHVPAIDIEKDSSGVDTIRVVVGKDVAHPNTIEHHIVWIDLFGLTKEGKTTFLGHIDLSPVYSNPVLVVRASTSQFKSLFALSYCNLHGVWENNIDV